MTVKERKNPALVSGSSTRKKRIAKGSGTTVQQVNKILKDFESMRKMMKQMNGIQKGFKKKKGLFGKFPF